MQRLIATCLTLLVLGTASRATAADKPTTASELARLAGEYTAESSLRTGHPPATKESLRGLALTIAADEWRQNFRGDVAPYKIALDPAGDPKAKSIRLTHKKVKAERNGFYELTDDTLILTEPLTDDGDIRVTVWKRKRLPN